MKKQISALRITLFTGFILFFITILIFTVFYFVNSGGRRLQRLEENFSKALQEYDLLASGMFLSPEDYEKLDKELDRLENMTISIESLMSVLKRRRDLWHNYEPLYRSYVTSLERALELYPMVPGVTALSVELLVKDTAVTREAEEIIRDRLPSFIGADYNDLLLSLHILLGDFRTPERALVIPDYLITDGTEAVTINLILLKMLKNNIGVASADVQTMYYTLANSNEGLRFIAEFMYDYGNLERSAEIFHGINDDRSLSRASDALYLAGHTGTAKNIWQILSASKNEKSLYNLGVTAEDPLEGVSYLEELLSTETPEVSIFKQFGLIQYSRLLNTRQALNALEHTRGINPNDFPYISLEICKRQSEVWELRRQIAESWLLLDRFPYTEELYLWSAWLFLFQRDFFEMEILLNRMEIQGLTASERNAYLPAVYNALFKMFSGDINTSLRILTEIPIEETGWVVSANLARIYEEIKNFDLAIEYYRLAIDKLPPPQTAAKAHIRMAMCLSALERTREARLSLQRAIELDPGNLNARMELEKILREFEP